MQSHKGARGGLSVNKQLATHRLQFNDRPVSLSRPAATCSRQTQKQAHSTEPNEFHLPDLLRQLSSGFVKRK
jgi:hypothetical protein